MKIAREVFISETNCITPIGFSVAANVENILNGTSGIQLHDDKSLMNQPFYASIINERELNEAFAKITQARHYTKLEKMMILALSPIVRSNKPDVSKAGLILSTTKGNICALQNAGHDIKGALLHQLAQTIADFFGFESEPIVLSNACVSGIMAVSVGKRLVQSGMYDEVFVVAGDLVSEFVLSGFSSFQAMSELPCKPYSKNRTGVTIGEAAAAVLITTQKENAKVRILGDGSINDANHISGPSRTGEGLCKSIESALAEANIESNEIDYISAHGTATPFNDEMEATAFNRLGLETTPINSFKGYYGHTLGASGLLETVIGIESVLQSQLFTSKGFDESGVSQPINVITVNDNKSIRYFLKTASGFGGSNTAAVFEKVIY